MEQLQGSTIYLDRDIHSVNIKLFPHFCHYLSMYLGIKSTCMREICLCVCGVGGEGEERGCDGERPVEVQTS